MARPIYSGGMLYNKTGSTSIYTWPGSSTSIITVADVINTQEATAAGITEVSNTIGGTPLNGNIVLEDIMNDATGETYLYDVTPDPIETITGFYLDGVEYQFAGGGGGGGTEYNAGQGISIGDVTMNARKGPSPEGFHVPAITEWQGVQTIMNSLSLTTGNNWRINLHIPSSGQRDGSDMNIYGQGVSGYCWSSSPYNVSEAKSIYLSSTSVIFGIYNRSYGYPVRAFKDTYIAPDSNWTIIKGTLGSAGIFWNQSEGLISITDGRTGYTIMDKNLGATTVYNDGDTLTQANMGNMYQWGNNYGFPSTGNISKTSSTQVDASAYGPTNPYSSETFITSRGDWSSVQNDDLWGDTTGTISQENVIGNTGVLSVNGQTGVISNVVTGNGQYIINVSTSAPASGTASNVITIVTD